jgi:hypothetical protein
MIIYRFNVRYWSGVDWCWYRETILAQSETQVIEYVDKQVAPQYRMKRGDNNVMYETLEIENEGQITLPYVID